MRLKLLQLFLVLIAGIYIFWLLQREYRYKYVYAGAMNVVVWRALNATSPEMLANLPQITDWELGVTRDAPRCTSDRDHAEFPVNCDFFGGNFGGKSRNCTFWWLGRQCRIFFVPASVYADPYVRDRLTYAFTHPCRVLFNGPEDTASPSSLGSHTEFLDSFNCRSQWPLLPFEIRLHIIENDQTIQIEEFQKV